MVIKWSVVDNVFRDISVGDRRGIPSSVDRPRPVGGQTYILGGSSWPGDKDGKVGLLEASPIFRETL